MQEDMLLNKLPLDAPCLACGRFANRGVTIDAVIVKDSKILLIKRGVEPFKGFWGLPGGYVGWDETIDDAVKRELKEELGVNVVALKQLSVLSNPNRHPKQCIDISYEVEIEGEPRTGDDASEFQFFPLNEIPEQLAFDHEQIIQDYLNKK